MKIHGIKVTPTNHKNFIILPHVVAIRLESELKYNGIKTFGRTRCRETEHWKTKVVSDFAFIAKEKHWSLSPCKLEMKANYKEIYQLALIIGKYIPSKEEIRKTYITKEIQNYSQQEQVINACDPYDREFHKTLKKMENMKKDKESRKDSSQKHQFTYFQDHSSHRKGYAQLIVKQFMNMPVLTYFDILYRTYHLEPHINPYSIDGVQSMRIKDLLTYVTQEANGETNKEDLKHLHQLIMDVLIQPFAYILGKPQKISNHSLKLTDFNSNTVKEDAFYQTVIQNFSNLQYGDMYHPSNNPESHLQYMYKNMKYYVNSYEVLKELTFHDIACLTNRDITTRCSYVLFNPTSIDGPLLEFARLALCY